MATELEKRLEKLEKKHGKGKFEIDTKHNLIKKKGWKVTKSLDALGLETVAKHIAKCEGKDENNPTVIEKIKKRIRKVEPVEL